MGNGDTTTYIHDKKRFSAQLSSIILAVVAIAGGYHHIASKLDRIESAQVQQVNVEDFETWIYWVERSNPELTMPSMREVWQIRRDIIRDRRGASYLGSANSFGDMLGSMIDSTREARRSETNEHDTAER